MAFNLDNYETVEDRLKRFWSENPNGRIDTFIHTLSEDGHMVVMGATVFPDVETMIPVATGFAQEFKGQGGFANNEAWLENCETSAIGRALANWKYQGTDKARPSREEMSKTSNSSTKGATFDKAPSKPTAPKEEVVVASSTTSPSLKAGPIAELEAAGFKVKDKAHPDGKIAIDEIGLWCPCGGAVKYVPREEKKSDKSPDFRCIMASKCTAGDTVDGKVFSKSWWVDNKATPDAWNDYAAVQNGVTMPEIKSLDEIKDNEAPF